jgi:hypothetical protein
LRKNYDLKLSIEDSYREGVSILSDLLDAQNLVQHSHDQYTEAVAGYYLKRAEYTLKNSIS